MQHPTSSEEIDPAAWYCAAIQGNEESNIARKHQKIKVFSEEKKFKHELKKLNVKV